MRKLATALALTAGTLLLAAPAGAATKKKVAYDPDREVCKYMQDTRSRLGRLKVCMTAAQWAEQRQSEQQLLREKQYNGAK